MAKIQFKTEKGVAKYSWLNAPDTTFDKENPKFTVTVRLAGDAAKDMVSLVKEAANDNFGKDSGGVRMPFQTDEETGDTLFKFSSKFQPKFADARGQLVESSKMPQIAGGSTMRVSGSVYPYTAPGKGISLQMHSVQIIDLVSARVEFDADESGGFVVETSSNDNDAGEASYDF